MTIEELNRKVKENKLDKLYLFYGEEHLLKEKYTKEICNKCINSNFNTMNLEILQGKHAQVFDILNACDTMPIMDLRRIVLVQNTFIFSSQKSNEGLKASEEELSILEKYISKIPDTTTLIFLETKIDKRNKLYKELCRYGKDVEFSILQGPSLVKWIQQYMNYKKKKMSIQTIHYFISTVESGLLTIQKELDKLCDYVGNVEVVIEADIDVICSKSLQAKIFDMVDGIGEKNSAKSIEIYNQLIFAKEPPLKILSLIVRQFKMIYQVNQFLMQGYILEDICKKINLPSFVVDKYIKQSKNFNEENLKKALKECLQLDINIKTGKVNDVLGVELLIVKYSY